MIFNSFEYAIFLPIVVIVFWLLVKYERLRLWWLIVASYYFYCCWDWRFAGLIVFSTATDYVAGLCIYKSQSHRVRKAWLIASLVVNFGCLGFFKYCDFFIDNFNAIFHSLGMHFTIEQLHIILPVGISFYTFQTLSYTLDIYRGNLKPTRSFSKFAMFVAFFPQLVAGPIVRAHEFLPQLEQKPKYDDDAAVRGIYQILSGLFKKVMIADILAATLVDPIFANPESFSSFWILLGIYGYTMQIYCDFSGYSDIAIGSARLMGYTLPINFNRPYLATSLTDFWRRWHISLSTWLRDYLYFPLGGNRFGTWKTYRNLFITMFLGGLWHGAAWNFVIWGSIHGVGLAIEKAIFGGKKLLSLEGQSKFVIFLRWFITFHIVVLCWIFFRAQGSDAFSSTSNACSIITRIMTLTPGQSAFSWWAVLVLILGYLMHFTPVSWQHKSIDFYVRSGVIFQAIIVVIFLTIYTIFGVSGGGFIYFQF